MNRRNETRVLKLLMRIEEVIEHLVEDDEATETLGVLEIAIESLHESLGVDGSTTARRWGARSEAWRASE